MGDACPHSFRDLQCDSKVPHMFIQPYQPHELKFAYCYRLYIRFRTYKCSRQPFLASLEGSILDALLKLYGVRVLKLASDPTDFLAIVSLQPPETGSSAADKYIRREVKWRKGKLELTEPANLLSKGYFAVTIGKTRRDTVEKYLSKQAEHHGYSNRPLPPIFSERYDLSVADVNRLAPAHAVVVAQFHCVLAVAGRKGVIGSVEGRTVAAEWKKVEVDARFAILKVSFVPDHVHVALRAHPAVSPVAFVLRLMNSAQEVLRNELVANGLDRLWQTSVYVGTYGDLASAQVRRYIENWEK